MQTQLRSSGLWRPAFAATAIALAGASCGKSGQTAPPSAVLTSVAVSPQSQSVVAGQTLQFTGTPRDQSGNVMSANVSWSSSVPSVASVSASGLATGVAAGVTTITATAAVGSQSAVQGTTSLTVTPLPVLTSVSATAPATTLVAGNTLQVTATPKDQSGAVISATVTYASSAATVAAVSASGLITGVAAGTATITVTATSGSTIVSTPLAITVTAAPALTSISINAPSTSLGIGATMQLTAGPKDQFGAAFSAPVGWSSSAAAVATVSSTGLVTGVAAGTATITAAATANGVTVTSGVLITITASPVLTSVTINAPSSSVAVGSTLQFTASPKDQFGNAIASALTWSSSVLAKATINSAGLVTGVATGTTNISVSATAGGVTVGSAPTVVTVTSPYPNNAAVDATLSNTFSPSSVDIALGGIVTWTFAKTHNVTFSAAPGVPADVPNTSSGSVPVTFNTAGTFNYQCTIHAGMTGVVIVH